MSPFAMFFEELERIEQAANWLAMGMMAGLALLLAIVVLI